MCLKWSNAFACVLVSAILLIAACTDEDYSVIDNRPYWISTTYPPELASNVDVGTTVGATFGMPMHPASINTTTFYLNNHAVPCSVWTDGTDAVLYPTRSLDSGTVYTAVLSGNIVDENGDRTKIDHTWSFKTAGTPPDTASPLVPTGTRISLEIQEDVYQGHYTYSSITATSERPNLYIGAFDFLIGYDASALTFMGADPGYDIEDCWEYFTYRYGSVGECDENCPSGMMRVVSIADINAAIGLALFCTLFSLFFIKFLRGTSNTLDRFTNSALLKAVIGGIPVAIIAFYFPYVRGEGYEFVENIISGRFEEGIFLILLIVIFKIMATSFTLGAGGAGGQGGGFAAFMPLILMFVIFYFLFINVQG